MHLQCPWIPLFFHGADLFAKNIDLLIEPHLQDNRNKLNSISELVHRENNVKTLVRVISDYLSDSILAGEMRPGDKLPSDRNFPRCSAWAGLSVREALKVLSVLGLIDICPGRELL